MSMPYGTPEERRGVYEIALKVLLNDWSSRHICPILARICGFDVDDDPIPLYFPELWEQRPPHIAIENSAGESWWPAHMKVARTFALTNAIKLTYGLQKRDISNRT